MNTAWFSQTFVHIDALFLCVLDVTLSADTVVGTDVVLTFVDAAWVLLGGAFVSVNAFAGLVFVVTCKTGAGEGSR